MSRETSHPRQSQEEQPILFFFPKEEHGYLSNFYPADFLDDGRKFNCVEQCFHAAKAKLFCDDSALKEIIKSQNPRKQKSIGRKVKGFVEEEWRAGTYQNLECWTCADGKKFQLR